MRVGKHVCCRIDQQARVLDPGQHKKQTARIELLIHKEQILFHLSLQNRTEQIKKSPNLQAQIENCWVVLKAFLP